VAGWIKIHRGILNHWVFADSSVFYLWTNLLMRANWKEGKFWPGGESAPVTIQRGQFVTGRRSLHSTLYPKLGSDGRIIKRETKPPHATTLWRWMSAMQKDGMIAMDVRRGYTIVTICNYETYQSDDEGSAPPCAPAVRRTCATGAPLVRTIEEREEGKKINTGFTRPSLDEVRTYCESRSNGINAEAFIDYYTSNGWRVGRNAMKDWKAAVRQWERNRKPVASASDYPLLVKADGTRVSREAAQ
jgi:hypothetical protein